MKKSLEESLNLFGKLITQNSEDTSLFTKVTAKNIKSHQNNYIYSLVDSLKASFPTVLELLEENNFNFFSMQYIKETPSYNPNIDLYGETFSNFLHGRDELKDQQTISHIAKLDWLFFSEKVKQSITLPFGTTKVWDSINNQTQLEENFEVSTTLKEKITLEFNGQEYYFQFES